jgi:hypothetical protein
MSEIAKKVYLLLKEIFPYVRIDKEVSVKYGGQQLYIDFYIPVYSIAIEVNGGQHYKFVKFYHQDVDGFRNQVKRDKLKAEWADINHINLVSISFDNMPENKEALLAMIKKEVFSG